MNRAAVPLRVVASHGRRQADEVVAHGAIIVCTEPQRFAACLHDQLDRSVFTFDSGDAALQKLQESSQVIDQFVADFRALTDRWTGQKFLKFIRDRQELDHVKVTLMADHWQMPQEQWIVKCGAEGFIKRQPDVVADRVLGSQTALIVDAAELSPGSDHVVTVAGDPWIEAVNQVFKRFAGALGAKLLTMQALEAMESLGQGDRHFYVSDLSSRLMNPGRRSEFLAALKSAGLTD